MYLVIPFVEGYVEKIGNSYDRNLITAAMDNNDDYDIIASPIDSVVSKNVVISSNNKNKEVLNKFYKLWEHIEGKIGSSGENCNKIRFNSDVVLPFDTPIKFHALTIIVRCIIMKDGKFYPEIYLDDGLYEI